MRDGGARLRLGLAVPRADRPAGRGAGGVGEDERGQVRRGARYLLCAVVGIGAGVGVALWQVRVGPPGLAIGPWTTDASIGTAQASARTRAAVAVHGLLALPAGEARYYEAETDDAGRPLDGHCRYRIEGGQLPARWWSLTVYDAQGYLIADPSGIHSLESAAVAPGSRWDATLAPGRVAGHWLPSGGLAYVGLTLRTYLPAGPLTRAQLPSIVRQGCA
nr:MULTISPECIES: DUF1214 domain-containing protein [unclassified Sphingomonas]